MITHNFKSYWDHTEQERAAMQPEDVTRQLDAELMIEGVLKPTPPPKARDVKDIEIPTTTRFVAKWNHSDGIAFETQAQAEAFAALKPLRFEREWEADRYFTKPMTIEVTAEKLPGEDDIKAFKAQLVAVKAERQANEKAKIDFDEAMKKVDRVTRGVWDDWREQASKLSNMKKVQKTFNEYLAMTSGDRGLAVAFLLKVFTVDVIRESALWTEDVDLANAIESWVDNGESPSLPPPVAKLAAPESEDICF